jgi:hypothetical protein
MPTHVVQQGENLAEIAASYGFGSVDPIANHGDNAELMKTRKAGVLYPGDVLTIPDAKPAEFQAATGQEHAFVVDRPEIKLRLAFQSLEGTALAGRSYRAIISGGTNATGTLDGDGHMEADVPVDVRDVEVVLEASDDHPEQRFKVKVGFLDPIDETAGLLERLQNLGYCTPDVADDEEAQKAAIEEFQHDNGVTLSGEADDATKSKLTEIHGC